MTTATVLIIHHKDGKILSTSMRNGGDDSLMKEPPIKTAEIAAIQAALFDPLLRMAQLSKENDLPDGSLYWYDAAERKRDPQSHEVPLCYEIIERLIK